MRHETACIKQSNIIIKTIRLILSLLATRVDKNKIGHYKTSRIKWWVDNYEKHKQENAKRRQATQSYSWKPKEKCTRAPTTRARTLTPSLSLSALETQKCMLKVDPSMWIISATFSHLLSNLLETSTSLNLHFPFQLGSEKTKLMKQKGKERSICLQPTKQPLSLQLQLKISFPLPGQSKAEGQSSW